MTQKKLKIGWLIIAVIAMMLVPKEAQAQLTPEKPSAGDGTAENPYQIANAANLYWFAGLVNGTLTDETKNRAACAVLTQDITVNENLFSKINANGNKENGATVEDWSPMGKFNDTSYTGVFNGQGYTISGLYCNSSQNYAGLYGIIGSDGIVMNVSVTESYIKGKSDVGGVCGINMGKISNCYNAGTICVTGSYSSVGGVCGTNNRGTILNCYNTGTCSATSTSNNARIKVGGVCGWSEAGVISDCYNTGSISARKSDASVGGVCGYNTNNGKIKNCYYLPQNNETGIGFNKVDTNVAEAKTETEFQNGEVAWLLNGNKDGNTPELTSPWLQDLGSDQYPVLKANADQCIVVLKKENVYSNPEGKIHAYNDNTFAEHPDAGKVNLYSVVCDNCRNAAGTDKKLIRGLNKEGNDIVITRIDDQSPWTTEECITLEDTYGTNWYHAPVEFTATTATFSRKLKNTWATLCLPYSISAENDKCTFYILSSVGEEELILTEIENDNIDAGTPLLIKRNAEDEGSTQLESTIEFEAVKNGVNNVKMLQTPTNSKAVGNGDTYKLTGTFDSIEALADNAFFIKNNCFWSVRTLMNENKITKMSLAPFRAYIEPVTDSKVKHFSITVDNNGTTSIDSIDMMNDPHTEYYNVNGNRINSLQKGVNIIRNGNKTRKIIVK